jgi:hypothetical protein
MSDGRDPISSSTKTEYDQVTPGKLREGIYVRAEGQWSGGSQANGADPNFNGGNGQRPWRSEYGQVAPGAVAAANGENVTPTTTPGYNGGRAGYNGVAPGYYEGGYGSVTPGATAGRGDYNQTAPGAGTTGGEVPKWTPKPENIPARPSANIPGQGNSGLAGAASERQNSIMSALSPHVSFMGNNFIGGASAAFWAGPGARLLDAGSKTYLNKSEGLISWAKGNPAEGQAAKAGWAEGPLKASQTASEWWQKHFGLRGGELGGLRKTASTLDVKLAETAEQLRPEFEAVQSKLGTGGATAEELALAERYNLLSSIRSTAGSPLTGTQIQEIITKGGGTAEEAAMMTERGLIRGRISALESELSATSGWRGAGVNFAKGWIASEVVQLVDDKLDRGLTGKLHNSYFSSLALPVAAIVPGGFLKRGLAAAGTVIAGKVLDGIFPAEKNPAFGRFMRPTGWETAAVTGALMLPMRTESFLARSLMVGGAWLGSKTIQYFAGGRSAEEAKNDAIGDWSKDKTERSDNSMNRTIDDFKDLATNGRQGLAAVKYYLADWRGRKHDDLVNGYRGSAILATALGETILKDGTDVGVGNGNTRSYLQNLTGSNTKEKDNLLSGYDLDLGSVAALNLRGARIELDRAKTETQKLASQGAELRGTKVQASEVSDLEKIGQRIDGDLNKIYGKHDIGGAFKELSEWGHNLNQRDMARIRDNLKNIRQRAVDRNDSDTRFMAKINRDLALVDLAFASSKVMGSIKDPTSAETMYQEACSYFQEARRFESNNPDNEQIDAIFNDLGTKIKPGEQWSSSTFNPLNVDDRLKK